MGDKFESFPPCCKKILLELEREKRRGARNCKKGHLVSLEFAHRAQASKPEQAKAS